jgi:hypothetical protein
MRIVHSRVIAKTGLVSVWLETVAAEVYAALPRIRGFVQGLVTVEDAEAEVAAAVERERQRLPYGIQDAMTDD